MAEIEKVTVLGTPALEGKYVAEMDMWPLESPEFNRLHPFYDNLRKNRFTTTKCRKCGYIAFPPGVICPKCWDEDVDWVDLPKKAKVVTFTETMAGAPAGFETPLIIAWLDFGEGSPLRHFLGRIVNCKEGVLKEGDEVEFVVFEVPPHPIEIKRETKVCERVYYAFKRVE
ncbi:MAG: OB-fold domain-containing protein [Deltaproteobacteria bacterium]|nr:OB-fold domain-containing protein [Deltaproteobacteria bacterium]